MEKLIFPTNIFSGLVFNDFIDKDPFITYTYAPYAERIVRLEHSYALILDIESSEVLYVDREHLFPEWVAYELSRPLTIGKLNRFISLSMECTKQCSTYKVYKHPSGIWACVTKSKDNYFTYWLFKQGC